MSEEHIREAAAQFRQRVRELEPYDACAWLGRPFQAHTACLEVEEMRSALQEAGYAGALVSHATGELYDAGAGNEALAAALKAWPGARGVMTLLPPGGHDEVAMERLLDQHLAHGLHAARMLPKSHRYTLKTPTLRGLLLALERRAIPLLIPIGQTGWAEIAGLAQAYAQLPVLVEGMGHHEFLNVRDALPWLEATPNLYVPTNRQFLCGGMELFVERLGVERVVFASNQPIDDPGAALGPLVYSSLPLDTLRQIAHGNLQRLLGSAAGKASEVA